MSRARTRLLTSAGVLAVLALLLTVTLSGDRDRLEETADLSRFQPGDIISDAVFFDGWSMSTADVQRFLDLKGANCRTGSDGSPCLRAYTQNTPDRAADAHCGFYDGQAGETAAAIIAEVGQACGINPRVLLVLVQKEQGLVTTTSPNATKYQKATGYACPDTAPCDSLYFGFSNQVYSAAHRFKEYAARPRNYFPGRWNTILYNPNSACGSSSVFILNQATAGLYTYTPYQPNTAALRAGYGTGDGCSAYGNRNFYNYYTDWFGSTHDAGTAEISAAYYRMGPASIGAPLAEPVCGLVAGGCLQHFEQASIYWSPASGAHVLRGGIGGKWAESGWETGLLGYPVGEEVVTADGVGRFQQFQGGTIYWAPATGAQVVRGAVLATWAGLGADTGVFGFPTTGELSTADGVGRVQRFQGGSILWSPATGAQPIRGGMFATWTALGADAGVFGFPVSGELPAGDGVGRVQDFQGGSLYWSGSTGAQPVRGGVLATYRRLGAAGGDLGYPVGPEGLVPGGTSVVQEFQRGTIHWSPATEGHAVLDALEGGFAARGGPTGFLGLPIADQRRLPGGEIGQDFQGGVLYRLTSSQTVAVHGGVLAAYVRSGGESGPLLLPVTDEETVSGAQVQRFQSGSIYWTAAGGAHPVRGGIGAAWSAAGGLSGALGAPTSDEVGAGPGRSQAFVGGTVYWSEATGGRAVSARLRDAYVAAGGPGGPLGFPMAEESTVSGAQVQRFQSGSIYWTAAGGAHPVRGGIGAAWSAAGGLSGALGAPTSDEVGAGPGRSQAFVGGTVYWSEATGGRAVSARLRDAYVAAGGPGGPLGFPMAEESTVSGAQVQRFQSGSIYWTAAGGAHPVRGGIGAAWSAAGGLSGALGAPTSDEVGAGPGRSQAFVGGTVYWSEATGGRAVSARLRDAYVAAGGPGGPLGFPMAEESTVSGAQVQRFQSGSIYWTAAGGAHPVRGGIGAAWSAAGGLSGALGAPTSDERALGGGVVQRFTGGALYWTSTGVARRMGNDVLDAWVSAGGPTGSLGEPVGDQYVRDGTGQVDFQRGRIVVRDGAVEVQPG
ncbi:LGFP repeat-containing protein [Geodermatophilus sp. URMC 63]